MSRCLPLEPRSLSKPTLRRLNAPHPKGTKVSTRCAGDYHGIDIGWLDRNPALGIKKPRLGEVRSWSDSEIAAFETRWPVGTRERLAFGLMLFTGQRRTDVFRMTWADINGDEIRVIRQSGGSSPG